MKVIYQINFNYKLDQKNIVVKKKKRKKNLIKAKKINKMIGAGKHHEFSTCGKSPSCRENTMREKKKILLKNCFQ